MFRGDTVKKESGLCAVFTERRSSASQMTAAKVMDIISRHPGMFRTSRCSILLYSSQNGRSGLPYWAKILVICALIDVSNYLDIVTFGIFNNVGAHSSRKESVRSSLGRTNMGKAIRESCGTLFY